MLALGYTTFPEIPDINPRSDCHAWSASPNYQLLSIVCGIRPDHNGFKSVVINPSLLMLPFCQRVIALLSKYWSVMEYTTTLMLMIKHSA
jgi:hypothetical protein